MKQATKYPALLNSYRLLMARADAFYALRQSAHDSTPLDVTVRTDRILSVPTQGELFTVPHQLEISL